MTKKPEAGIYAITNMANGKQYIGSAVDIRRRWRGHLCKLRKGLHHSQHLQAAWTKYGEEAFTFSILELVSEKAALLAAEDRWLSSRGVTDRIAGYNICKKAGSQLGLRHSEETRKKMSDAQRGRQKTEAHQAAINAALKGRKLSDEHRQKIAANQTGRRASDEAKRKMREANATRKERMSPEAYERMVKGNLGRKFSPEHCAKIAAANTGRVMSLESREKISRARKENEAMKKNQRAQSTLEHA